jgi:hypothetical protein
MLLVHVFESLAFQVVLGGDLACVPVASFWLIARASANSLLPAVAPAQAEAQLVVA